MSIKHIYREVNRCTDALANDAPVSIRDFYIYLYFPSRITDVFRADMFGVVYPRAVTNQFVLMHFHFTRERERER